MASFSYDHPKQLLGQAGIDFDAVDLSVILVLVGSTCTTQKDVTTFAGFITPKEHTHASYNRILIPQSALTWQKDAAGNRSVLLADDTIFPSLEDDVSGDAVIAAVVCIQTGTITVNADQIPLRYVDSGGFPTNPTGQNFVIDWNDVDGVYWLGED